MNTTENNTLIAEFLGANSSYENEFGEIFLKDIPNPEGGGTMILRITRLKYHLDWNWLMQVVEKIEKTKRSIWSKNTFPCVTIKSICCNIQFHGNYIEKICDIVRPSKIEAVYTACVEFINWYNKNIK